MKFSRELAFWLVAYVALMASLTGAMFFVRGSVLKDLDTPQARESWKEWKDEAEKRDAMTRQARGEQPAEGTAKPWRTRGNDPPLLRFMRDMFWTCLGIMYLIFSVMFGVFALLLRGAMTTGSGPLEESATNDANTEAH